MIDDWVVAIIAACHRAPLFCRTNAPLDHGGCICLDAASEFAIKQSLTWIQDLEWRTRLSEKWNLGYGHWPAMVSPWRGSRIAMTLTQRKSFHKLKDVQTLRNKFNSFKSIVQLRSAISLPLEPSCAHNSSTTAVGGRCESSTTARTAVLQFRT